MKPFDSHLQTKVGSARKDSSQEPYMVALPLRQWSWLGAARLKNQRGFLPKILLQGIYGGLFYAKTLVQKLSHPRLWSSERKPSDYYFTSGHRQMWEEDLLARKRVSIPCVSPELNLTEGMQDSCLHKVLKWAFHSSLLMLPKLCFSFATD